MSLTRITHLPDGGIVFTPPRKLTKTVRLLCPRCSGSGRKPQSNAPCRRCRGSGFRGKRTLTSYDGITWALDTTRLRRRIERQEQHRPGHIDAIQTPLRASPGSTAKVPDAAAVRISGGIKAPKDLPDRNPQKPEPSVKPAKPPRRTPPQFPDIPLPRKVHRHRCEGHVYVCSCPEPFFKRLCGITCCLQSRAAALNH